VFGSFTGSFTAGNRKPFNISAFGLTLDAGSSSSYLGSGTTWTDLSGYANHATLVNGTTYSSLNYGVLDFDGTNDYADVGSKIQLNRSQGFSFNAWVRFDSLTGWQTIIGQDTLQAGNPAAYYFQKSTDAATGFVGLNSNTFLFNMTNTSGVQIQCADTTTVSTGVWYNFSVTVSSSEIKLYRNGVLVNTLSNSDTMAPTTDNMLIGAGYWNNSITDYVNGKIPVVQVYDRVLTAAEVLTNFNTYAYRYPVGSPFLWYDPSTSYSGSGSSLTDLTGGVGNATLYNSPAYTSSATGAYFTLDGVNDYITTPNLYSLLTGGEAHTIEIWIRPAATNVNIWSDADGSSGSIYHSSGAQIIQSGPFNQAITSVWNNTNGVERTVAGIINLNTWNQIVRVYSGTQLTSYLNGSAANSPASIAWRTPVENGNGNNWFLQFGVSEITSYNASTANYFSGRIGVIRVYNSALSAAQIQSNYNSTKAIYGL